MVLGDAVQVLKGIESEAIDGVIMDPPYCSGGFNESGKTQAKGQGLRSETIKKTGWFVNDNMTTAGLVWLLRNVMIELERVLKPGGSALVFTDWRMVVHLAPALESAGFRFQNLLVWDKMSMGLGVGFRHQHEMILHFVKGTGVFHNKSTSNVLKAKRVNHTKRIHQTEKPTELLAQLVKVVSKPGDLLLDPFCGSGSLGETCVKMGRNFIGIDKGAEIVQRAGLRIDTVSDQIQNSFFPNSDSKTNK